MARKKKQLPKRTFGVGEIDPKFQMRRDTEQYKDAAKRFRNARLLNSGSFTRKPGSHWIATPSGDGVLIGFYFNDAQKYVLVFSNTRMDAYLDDGTAAGSITSAPWTTAMLPDLRYQVEGDTIFLCHQTLRTQKILRTSANTWSTSNYSFDAGFGSTISQPYYKFADPAMTLTPGATTGSVSLTTSAAFFDDPDHVGVRLRYLGREIEITGVTNSTTATGTVKETLPSAQRLTVTSSAVFQVGHVVEHSVDGTKGKVFNISDSTHVDVIPTEGVQAFPASGSLVGPDGSTAISATASANLPALTDWDEQVFSAVRGYPGVVGLHRDRLVFADHPGVPDAIMFSRVGQYFNHDLGEQNASDAIFEFIGDGSVTRVRGLVSSENLMILTNAGPYFVPERSGSPITPTTIEIKPFGSSGAGDAIGGRFASGIVFPDSSGKRITRISPSGNLEQPWQAVDVSLLSAHLISNPVSAAYADRFANEAERYAFFVNDDGTIAVYMNIEDQNVNGFGLWSTTGTYKSVCVVGDDVFALAQRTIGGNTTYTLERLDNDLRLDCVKTFISASDDINAYASHTVRVTGGDNYDFGEVDVRADGTLEVETEFEGPFQAGFFFAPDVIILPSEVVSDETIAGLVKRYTKIKVHVYESGVYSVNGKSTTAYRADDDLTSPPPLRTEVKRFSDLGRSEEPEIRITQDEAVPLTVLGLSMEVSF